MTAPAAIVLAAGAGTRLRPLTTLRPKALCPVANVPLVDRALTTIGRAGIRDVAANAHHLAGQIVSHLDGRVHVSVERSVALGTAGAVGALRSWLDGRHVLIYNSDAYLDGGPDVLHRLIDGWTGAHPRALVVRDAARADFDDWRFAGASLLPWSYAHSLPAEPAGLYEAVWRAADERGVLELVEHTGTFIDCGTPQDYLAANLHASGGASVIGAGAVVDGELVRSVVWPGAAVGRTERLVDCVRTDTGLTVDCSAGATR